MWRAQYVIFIVALAVVSCSKKVSRTLVSTVEDVENLDLETSGVEMSQASQRDSDNETFRQGEKTSLIRERKIRVAFHFVHPSHDKQIISEKDAPNFVWNLVSTAQEKLSANQKMNLPLDNDTPAINPMYRYNIYNNPNDDDEDGIFHHYDENLYYYIKKGPNRNNYKTDLIKKYVHDVDSVLNVFVLSHHPDSIASKTYNATKTGIALNNNIKLCIPYYESSSAWEGATLLNHEVGHVLGLNHSWIKRDNCSDTPPHENCYDSYGTTPCSNNMMDYNSSQLALTPCQIGIIHSNFAKEGSQARKLLIRDWCKLQLQDTIYIKGHEVWKKPRDLTNHIIVEDGSILEVQSRISMPENGKITVMPGGLLIGRKGKFHQDCGLRWDGIEVLAQGEKQGNVFFSEGFAIQDVQKVEN